jgi:Tfp pilus assembly protein PilO
VRARRRVALAVAGVFVGNVVLFGAYTLPRRVKQKTVTERVKVLRSEVERQRGQVAARREVVEAARANAEDTRRFYSQVLATRRASLHDLLVNMEREAGGLGLRLDERIDEARVTGAPLERYTIQVTVTGTYRQLVSFLGRLERSPQFLTIDQVQIAERGTGHQAALHITISAYFKREDADGRAS